MTTKYGGFDPRKLPDDDVRRYRRTFMERLRAWQDRKRRENLDKELDAHEREGRLP